MDQSVTPSGVVGGLLLAALIVKVFIGALVEAFPHRCIRREQRRCPCSVQGADGQEDGLPEESPGTACQIVLCGSVHLVRLCYRVSY